MRLDTESCFRAKNKYLPKFLHSDLVYHSQYHGIEFDKNRTLNLFDFATSWLKANGKVAGDPFMWDFIKSTKDKHQSLPMFRTSFELMSKSFMQSKWVATWHESLTEKEPFGVFKYGWIDRDLRFMTMALFSTNDKIVTKGVDGHGHGVACPKEYIEQELTRLKAMNWMQAPLISKQF